MSLPGRGRPPCLSPAAAAAAAPPTTPQPPGRPPPATVMCGCVNLADAGKRKGQMRGALPCDQHQNDTKPNMPQSYSSRRCVGQTSTANWTLHLRVGNCTCRRQHTCALAFSEASSSSLACSAAVASRCARPAAAASACVYCHFVLLLWAATHLLAHRVCEQLAGG